MQNTYQDLITAVQNKNPAISPKLEGGKKFQMKTDFKPAGDQPEAIKQLVNGANKDQLSQVLLGVTGSGKTFTMAKVIEKTNRPALILAPNKTSSSSTVWRDEILSFLITQLNILYLTMITILQRHMFHDQILILKKKHRLMNKLIECVTQQQGHF